MPRLDMAGMISAALDPADGREMAAVVSDVEARSAALPLPGFDLRARRVNCLLTLAEIKLIMLEDLAPHCLLPEEWPIQIAPGTFLPLPQRPI